MESIAVAKDTLAVNNITPFGYPEWQTYLQTIGNELKSSNAVFYTTFLLSLTVVPIRHLSVNSKNGTNMASAPPFLDIVYSGMIQVVISGDGDSR